MDDLFIGYMLLLRIRTLKGNEWLCSGTTPWNGNCTATCDSNPQYFGIEITRLDMKLLADMLKEGV